VDGATVSYGEKTALMGCNVLRERGDQGGRNRPKRRGQSTLFKALVG